MSGVILTHARFWNTLAATRCLGQHGVKVACGDSRSARTDYLMPAAWSRYCSRSFAYPSHATNPTGFVEALCDFMVRNREYDVLMPMDDETNVIAQHRDTIESSAPHVKMALHEFRYLQMANNKRQVGELAKKIGVPVPRTCYPGSVQEARIMAGQMEYPAVIKVPCSKGGTGMTYVNTPEEAVSTYEATVSACSPDTASLPMIQEYIPGTDYGAACLFNHGQLRARIAFMSLRDWPPSGGIMVVRVSVAHEQMLEYLVALATEMHWHGVIMADFRQDNRDNTPKLLEVNPRFWGSLYQAIASGIDFPYLLYRMAVDGDISPALDYKVGVKTRYLWGDLKALPGHLRVCKSRLAFLSRFCRLWGTRYDDMSCRDPLPVAALALNLPIRFVATGHWTSPMPAAGAVHIHRDAGGG